MKDFSREEGYRQNLIDGLRALGVDSDRCPEPSHGSLTFGESIRCLKHPNHLCFRAASTPGELKLPFARCDANLPNFPLDCLESRLEKAASRHPRHIPAVPTSQ